MRTPKEIEEFCGSDAYLQHQAAAGELLAKAILGRTTIERQAALDVYVESQQELGKRLREEK